MFILFMVILVYTTSSLYDIAIWLINTAQFRNAYMSRRKRFWMNWCVVTKDLSATFSVRGIVALLKYIFLSNIRNHLKSAFLLHVQLMYEISHSTCCILWNHGSLYWEIGWKVQKSPWVSKDWHRALMQSQDYFIFLDVVTFVPSKLVRRYRFSGTFMCWVLCVFYICVEHFKQPQDHCWIG